MGNIVNKKSKKHDRFESNEMSYDNIFKALENISNNDVENVPYKNRLITAKITSVYDGDTCTCVFMYGNKPMRVNIRVIGIDAPELKTKNELEKQAGICVRDLVRNHIENKICQVKILKHDKYGGRVVGDVYFGKNKTSLSQYLLNNGYVKSYGGNKKEEWTDYELNEIIRKTKL